MESRPPPIFHPPLSSQISNSQNLDPAQIIIDSIIPSSSRTMEDVPLALPTTALAGVETPTPDPRWPSKCRWSVQKSPPSSAVTAAPLVLATIVTDAAPSSVSLAGQPSVANGVSDLSDQVVIDVTSSSQAKLPSHTQVMLPLESSKKGTNLKNPIYVSAKVISEPANSVFAPQGAWAQPNMIISSASMLNSTDGIDARTVAPDLSSTEKWPSLMESKKGKAPRQKGVGPIRKPFKVAAQNTYQADRMEDDLRFPWAARMNPVSRNLYRALEPEYLDDGTPKVTIPQHVLLQGLENQKEYILGQFYRCAPPPGGLIFAVFNKLWGRKCRITIRKLGESNYLFHIPDETTRIWVLQRGLWHVDDCLMFVAPWAPEATLAIPEIKTIPVWVTLKKIPNICYSIAGISHIASGLGAPMATHKPRLDPILMGEAKILVEVELNKAFPSRIAASDKTGFISMVDVEYAWLPTKCCRCGQLGHKVKRCLQSATANDSEIGIVVTTDASASVPVNASQSPAPVQAISNEVVSDVNTTLPINDSTLTVPAPTSPVIRQANTTLALSTVLPANTMIEHIQSPLPETAPFLPASTSMHVHVTVLRESNQADHGHTSNRFASLASSEVGEESSDSDKESDSMDLMTPSGKRILRERPVKPSVKAKENLVTGGGRGRGRGKRGGCG